MEMLLAVTLLPLSSNVMSANVPAAFLVSVNLALTQLLVGRADTEAVANTVGPELFWIRMVVLSAQSEITPPAAGVIWKLNT
jgi:hypothetical protein